MLPSIALVLSVEMIRDGGSLAVVFQGANGAEYWLFFEHSSRQLASGRIERLGYRRPIVIERKVGMEMEISWEHARIFLNQVRPLVRENEHHVWLERMVEVACTKGKLPSGVEP